MAVEVKYVVIREGEEKMSFASKKEADAYDKMLDTADLLDTWLEQSPVALEDEQREARGRGRREGAKRRRERADSTKERSC